MTYPHPRLVWFATMVGSRLHAEFTEETEMVLAVDGPLGAPKLLFANRGLSKVALQARIDQLMAGQHQLAAMASRISWSPDDSPLQPAWLLVTVLVGQTALFSAIREGDDAWRVIPPDDVPWAHLSTAGGLRAAIEQGHPMRLKQLQDKRLLRKPSEDPNPPTDDRGEL